MAYTKWQDVVPQEGKQELAMNMVGKVDFMLMGGARFGGKALYINELVHTPTGTKLLKDVADGDILLNPEGGTTKVVYAHPTHNTQVYRMTFSDGSVIDACKDHKWYGSWRCDKQPPFNSWDNKFCVKNTLQIYNHYNNSSSLTKFRIPLTSPLEYTTKKLIIDPYLLGCLLGAGCLTQELKIKQTCHKEDILHFLELYNSLGYYPSICLVHENCSDLKLSSEESKALSKKINRLGLLGSGSSTKFIPDDYLYGDITQRRALLQGMLDTGGGVYTPTGSASHRIDYTTISDKLKEGFCQLAASLGYAVTPYYGETRFKTENDGTVYECKPSWHIEIKSKDDTESFRLSRKREAITTIRDQSWQPCITLESIELCKESKLMRCLTVDHSNQLFVVGKGCIPTHNSELLSMMPLMFSEDSKYRGIFFRRQYDEIMGANSLWEKAENMYQYFDGKPHLSSKSWSFPTGAKQFYRHMYVETDKESHRGKGYSLIGFDEIDQFSKEQVTFLMTCLRSEAEMDSFCVGTLI